MKLIYPAIFTPYDDNSGYDVEVPDLEGCSSGGDTLEEAMENICDEAARYILIHMESGRIPLAETCLCHHSRPGMMTPEEDIFIPIPCLIQFYDMLQRISHDIRDSYFTMIFFVSFFPPLTNRLTQYIPLAA